MMMKRFLSIALVFLLGCIDPMDVDMDTQRRHLVVEASLTNVAKLNYVRLSYSQPHSVPYNSFEEHANVFITSEDGDVISFYYSHAGYYFPVSPAEMVGVPGKTYTLTIWADGKEYKSEPVTMVAPLPVNNVHFKLDEQPFAFPGERKKELMTGYQVMLDYTDPGDAKNYLRWSFETEYEILTQPWDYIDPMTGDPAPKDCCAQCFLSEKLEAIKVADDRLNNGRNVINKEVLFLPFDRYLDFKNKLTIYQHSTSAASFNFFRILEQQKNSTGTVFDPPPAEVTGNMRNTEDDNEQVIGFFDVSGVSVKQITILRSDIKEDYKPLPFPDDCRVIPGATTQKPAGW